jgi:hypothetical protein
MTQQMFSQPPHHQKQTHGEIQQHTNKKKALRLKEVEAQSQPHVDIDRQHQGWVNNASVGGNKEKKGATASCSPAKRKH